MAMPKRSSNISADFGAFEQRLASLIGARIRERRKELGLTQEELRLRTQAAHVYMTRTQYSRAELGESLLNVAEVIA